MPIRSKNAAFTVSPEVFASNLVVMGSVPPLVPLAEAQVAIDVHGEEFAFALFDALEALGRRVERPSDKRERCVVVDERDGLVIEKDALNRSLTLESASRLARQRNDGMLPAHQTYRVYRLVLARDADVEPRTGAAAE